MVTELKIEVNISIYFIRLYIELSFVFKKIALLAFIVTTKIKEYENIVKKQKQNN